MFHSHTHIQIITIDGRINLEQFKSKVLHFVTGRCHRVTAATITR